MELVPYVGPGELESCLRALNKLRETQPGIIIDRNVYFKHMHFRETQYLPSDCDTRERAEIMCGRQLVHKWKEAGCPPYQSGNRAL